MLKIDPRSLPPEQYRNFFCDFIQKYEFDQFIALLLRDAGSEDYVPFLVDSFDLLQFDPTIGFLVINYPKLLLQVFEDALFELQSVTVMNKHIHEKYHKTCTIKKNCKIRIHSLPPIPELNKSTLGQIRSQESESLLQISGTVVRTGTVRMLELSKEYQCMNPKCGFRFKVFADPEQGYMVPQPRICPSSTIDKNRDNNVSNQYKCKSVNLRVVEGSRDLVDYQEIKVQDQVDRLEMGNIPRSMNIVLEADLVDKYNAGDNVVIVGILVRQWRPVMPGVRCQLDIVMKAVSVIILNAKEVTSTPKYLNSSDTVDIFGKYWEYYHQHSKPFTGRNHILRAVCPSLCGLMMVKLSLLLTLIGGGATSEKGGIRRRSQSHLLIVGDPGTGKSQLLRFAAAVATRSVLTTGIGTSGAGLTCTAVRDGGDWCLEAGALVLANEGLCCIDEFSSIKEQDRASIHEAMEQQTLSVAKAGMVVKLNTRTTVIAVANPKGSYDVTADLSANTAIATPLLSRFDLILVLLDSPLKSWDIKMSTFLLQQAVKEGGGDARSESTRDTSNPMTHSSTSSSSSRSRGDQQSQPASEMAASPLRWSIEKLRDYISTVKTRFQPSMSAAAQCLLMRYYQQQRQSADRSVSRTTIRLLESLVRLSEAHAKLMSQHEVRLSDAIVAIGLMELSMNSISLLDPNSPLHADFPPDAEREMEELETRVMSKLNYSKRAMEIDIAAKSGTPCPKKPPRECKKDTDTDENRSSVLSDGMAEWQCDETLDGMMQDLPSEVFGAMNLSWDGDGNAVEVSNGVSVYEMPPVTATATPSSVSLWETSNHSTNGPPSPLPLPLHSHNLNEFKPETVDSEWFSQFSDNYNSNKGTIGGDRFIPERQAHQVPLPLPAPRASTATGHSLDDDDDDEDHDLGQSVHQSAKQPSLTGVRVRTPHDSTSTNSLRSMKRKCSTVDGPTSGSRWDDGRSSFRNNLSDPYPRGIAVREGSSSGGGGGRGGNGGNGGGRGGNGGGSGGFNRELPLKTAANQSDLLGGRLNAPNTIPNQQQYQLSQSVDRAVDDSRGRAHPPQSKSANESRRKEFNSRDDFLNKSNSAYYNGNSTEEFFVNQMPSFTDFSGSHNTHFDHKYDYVTATTDNLKGNKKQSDSHARNDLQEIKFDSRVGKDTCVNGNEDTVDFINSNTSVFDFMYNNQMGIRHDSNNIKDDEKSIINLSFNSNISHLSNITPNTTKNMSQVSSSLIQDILLVDDW